MASDQPTDAAGHALGQIVRKAAARSQSRSMHVKLGDPFVVAVKQLLARERRERADQVEQLRREVEALRSEVVTLREQYGTSRRLDEIQQRLVQLEAAPRSGLRAV